MRAIETRYKGYRFRSRLEARWAVFFDALGIGWEYEPEGYDLGEADLYLPDFWLPNISNGIWVEIKGQQPTKQEIAKIAKLALKTGHIATFRIGEPMRQVNWLQGNDGTFQDDASIWNGGDDDNCCDSSYIFCLCPWCHRVGLEFDGRGARVCGYRTHYSTEEEALDVIKHLGHWRADDKCYTGQHPKIISAAKKARSARFEHGENGGL